VLNAFDRFAVGAFFKLVYFLFLKLLSRKNPEGGSMKIESRTSKVGKNPEGVQVFNRLFRNIRAKIKINPNCSLRKSYCFFINKFGFKIPLPSEVVAIELAGLTG
jgi:hypothetical protein